MRSYEKYRRNKRYRRYVPVLMLAVLMGTSSCVAPLLVGGAAGAGGFAYYKGELVRTYSKSVGRCYSASLTAIKTLRLPIVKKSKDAFGASIESRMSYKKTVYIRIKGATDKTTEISIRVGLFGDEKKSARIFKTIEKHLL